MAKTAKFRIFDGAVRSGKTFTANNIAIAELRKLPPGRVLISGESIDSARRNVVAEWIKLIDPTHKGIFQIKKTVEGYYMTIDYPGLRDKKFDIRGGSKENDEQRIRGATYIYHYCDELTLHKRNFIDMSVTRLSLPYSKAIYTTNPSSPKHWVKDKILDSKSFFKQKDGESLYLHLHFELDDNPALTESYKQGLLAIYPPGSLFYKRMIKGLWVAAEGIIYNLFSEDRFVIDNTPSPEEYEDIIVAIDYGITAPTCFLLIGKKEDRFYIFDEYFYDSTKTFIQKTDSQYENDLSGFLMQNNLTKDKVEIIRDRAPIASSFNVLLSQLGYSLQNTNNDVLLGIRKVTECYAKDRILINKKCKNLIAEIFSYGWNPKATERGLDEPLKENDHCVDAKRYGIMYLLHKERIQNMEESWY